VRGEIEILDDRKQNDNDFINDDNELRTVSDGADK